MSKNMLDKLIDEKFQKGKKSTKKPKKRSWLFYVRPILFMVIISVTLSALIINVAIAVKYFINH